MALRRGQGERARESAREPCPVCFEETVTERSYFPCGHSVCISCNATLLQRGFLNCPTCRTPREGVSQAAVDHASQQRVLREQGGENGGAGTPIGLPVSHAGERYRIIFFPDESQGSPFATLGRQDMSGLPAPGGRGARAMRPMRAVRTLRLAPPYHTQRRSGRGQEEAVEEEEEEEGGEGNQENRPPGARIALDGPMEALVDGLLNPVDVPEFLARRQRV